MTRHDFLSGMSWLIGVTPIAAVAMPVAVVITTAAWRARGHRRARNDLRDYLELLATAKQAGLTEEKLRPIELAAERRRNKWELWEMAPFRWVQRIFLASTVGAYLLLLILQLADFLFWHKFDTSILDIILTALLTCLPFAFAMFVRTLIYAYRDESPLFVWVSNVINSLFDSIETRLVSSTRRQVEDVQSGGISN